MMRARLVRWRTAAPLLLLAAGLPVVVAAQGVTTAAIDGFITQETGEPISLMRLEARPVATLSVEAQERHERRERFYSNE